MIVAGAALAFGIGVSLGLFGGGGSILTVPVLRYAFGLSTQDAIATSLVVVAITSAAALTGHVRHVRWKVALAFGAVSMIAAFAGGVLGERLPASALMIGFAAVSLVAGAAMLRGVAPRAVSNRHVLAVAAGVGLLTGILGAGGGFLIVPALTLGGGLALHEAIGTSLLAIVLNTSAAYAAHASRAPGDVRVAIFVTLIAIVGSFAGAWLQRRLPGARVRRGFGWFVIAVGAGVAISVALES